MDTRVKYENIILIDGNCALCHAFVRWIIKNKKEDSDFRFSSLQYLGMNEPQTVILFKNDAFYTESDVLLEISGSLRKKAKFWILILRVLPKKIRNFFYRNIAKNRYRWFGKISEDCYLEYGDRSKFWLAESDLKEIFKGKKIPV